MFSVFSIFTQPQKKNLLQICIKKSCFDVFLKTSKCGHLIMCWIGKPVTGCYIYVDRMGLYTNVNSLIFWVHYSSQKISENETALNCALGFAIEIIAAI